MIWQLVHFKWDVDDDHGWALMRGDKHEAHWFRIGHNKHIIHEQSEEKMLLPEKFTILSAEKVQFEAGMERLKTLFITLNLL